MRSNLLTIFLLLAGFFVPVCEVNAVVIKSTDNLEKNYAIHHRTIIYNDLSSYQNSYDKQRNNEQSIMNQKYPTYNSFNRNKNKLKNIENLEDTKLTQFSLNSPYLETTFPPVLNNQSDLIFNNGGRGNHEEVPLGSFLDDFKEDPLLLTIYFTSKSLIFGYKKKIANILQLGFDTEEKDYQTFRSSRKDSSLEMDSLIEKDEEKNLKQKNRFSPEITKDSYKNTIYVVIAMLAGLFLCFRYILNKYI